MKKYKGLEYVDESHDITIAEENGMYEIKEGTKFYSLEDLEALRKVINEILFDNGKILVDENKPIQLTQLNPPVQPQILMNRPKPSFAHSWLPGTNDTAR